MTRASIIVINWNGAAFLDTCLEALLAQVGSEDEIIVVDNNSTDNSVGLLRARFPGVKLLCNERNLGYAGGANVGLRAAQGDVCILLNPDVQVHAGWLAALKDALQDERAGVVGCKLFYPGDEVIQHAGGIIHFPRATADHYGYRQRDEGQWNQARKVDYVTGAALALRRDLLDKVGFFDEGFYPAYYEEVDFCFRVREAGYQVRYVPGAVATHYEHAALGEESEHYIRFFHRNRLRFVLKHYEPQRFLNDFLPAEMDWLRQGAPFRARHVLGSVYLDAMLSYPRLYLDHGAVSDESDSDTVNVILEALAGLRDQISSSCI
jgi:GT2 family glycosyltransferase